MGCTQCRKLMKEPMALYVVHNWDPTILGKLIKKAMVLDGVLNRDATILGIQTLGFLASACAM